MYVKKPVKKVFKRKVSRKPKASKSFVKKVQAIVNKNVEEKQAVIQYDNVSFNSGINATGDALYLMPSIPQGTDNANRIGNRIRAKYLDIRGHFQINVIPTSLVALQQQAGQIPPNCRLAVRMFILMVKQFPTQETAGQGFASWMPQLLSNGLNNKGFDGQVRDTYLDTSKECVVVYYDKVSYINMPVQYVIPTNANTVVPMGGVCKIFQKTNFTKE